MSVKWGGQLWGLAAPGRVRQETAMNWHHDKLVPLPDVVPVHTLG